MSQRTVTIVPANPDWPAKFAEEAALLKAVLGDLVVAIHHMGSTAVPGLPAKPTLDILIEVNELARVDACNPAMQAQGYVPQGEKGIPRRRFFQKGGNARTHHVHVYQAGDAHVARHLAFRDYLRAHPGVCSEYSQLKQSLAALHVNSPVDYQAGKDAFIQAHEARALQWVANGMAHASAEAKAVGEG